MHKIEWYDYIPLIGRGCVETPLRKITVCVGGGANW